MGILMPLEPINNMIDAHDAGTLRSDLESSLLLHMPCGQSASFYFKVFSDISDHPAAWPQGSYAELNREFHPKVS